MFLIFALLQRKERRIWGVLFITSLSIKLLNNHMSHDFGSSYYYIRAIITFIAAFILIRVNTLHSYHQSGVYVITLIAFSLLEFDLVSSNNIIYDNYEKYINGIIIIKFLGLLISISERLSTSDNARDSHNSTYLPNNSRCKEKC